MPSELTVERPLTLVVAPQGEREALAEELRAEGAVLVHADELPADAASLGLELMRRKVAARSTESRLLVVDGDPLAGLDAGEGTQVLSLLAGGSGVRCVYLSSSPRPLTWASELSPDLVHVDVRRTDSSTLEPAVYTTWRPHLLPLGITLAALVVWLLTVRQTDLRGMGDLGLAPELPVPSLFAIGVVSASFWLVVRRRPLSTPTALVHVVVLVLMLYGVTTILEEVVRLNVSWRHAGVIEQLTRTADVDRTIDAYFNWPGFFALAGALTALAGLDHPIDLAPWAPVYFNLFYAAALFLLVRQVSSDVRVQWLAVWIFLLANWVNQDYFAPQAVAFAAYLVIALLVMTWLRPSDVVPIEPRRAVAAMAVVTVLFLALVPSHQLTPFAVVAGIAALVVVRRCTARGLPILLGVAVVAWVSIVTEPFLAGRIHDLVGSVGDLSQSAKANVGERLKGSPEHVLVVRLRLVMTAGLWVLAGMGALRRWQQGRRDLALVALAAAPAPLLGFQPYGGEMLLRVYLFALPFVAVLAATAFFPNVASARTRLSSAPLLVLLALMPAGFLFARYGNERINQYTREELQAVEQLYDMAPQGALLVAGSGNLPWRWQGYAEYDYLSLLRIEDDRGRAEPRLEDLLSVVRDRDPGCAYVIVTRAEHAYVDLLGVWRPGALAAFERDLRASPFFERTYGNDDASIYQPTERLTGGPAGTEQGDDGERAAAGGRCAR